MTSDLVLPWEPQQADGRAQQTRSRGLASTSRREAPVMELAPAASARVSLVAPPQPLTTALSSLPWETWMHPALRNVRE